MNSDEKVAEEAAVRVCFITTVFITIVFAIVLSCVSVLSDIETHSPHLNCLKAGASLRSG